MSYRSEQDFLDDILFHRKRPSHQGALTGDHVIKLGDSNPSCGDEIELQLEISLPLAGRAPVAEPQGVRGCVITNATYTGTMCSIANYGAELLLGKIIGMELADALSITSTDLLPADCTILQNPIRLKCFEAAQRALSRLNDSPD